MEPAQQEPSSRRRAGKRDRVGLACQRCQRRKQKCDGRKPSCATCTRHRQQCTYVEPSTPSAAERKLYINALEQRVAELESKLSSLGHGDASEDHFQYDQPHVHSVSPSFQSLTSDPLAETQQTGDEGNEIVIAVRDLSLSASGHYIGASSNINIARILSSFVSNEDRHSTGDNVNERSAEQTANLAPKSAHTTDNDRQTNVVPPLDSQAAERLIKGWLQHIATRYPILHTPAVKRLFDNRNHLDDEFDICTLFLVLAVSGRWLESAGETGYFFSEQYFELALSKMDRMLRFRDERTLNYLVLLALYCTRAPHDPGAWTYIGAAMRLCIELGLHRSHRYPDQSIVNRELRKRGFWTTYFLDRDIAFAIGRPPSISDRDIDAEYPLDIDEDVDDEATVYRTLHQRTAGIGASSTTLSPFIHRLRLKRLESEIQHEIYRVDTLNKPTSMAIDNLLQQLDDWRNSIPTQASNYVHDTTNDSQPYDGMEFYTIHYYRGIRFLLYPQLYRRSSTNLYWVKRCADACRGILSDYRRLHLTFPVGFSALSIQSVFVSGLTLIYCAWLGPEIVLAGAEQSLTDCQLLLYIICERYASAKRYRDTFERLKTAALSKISSAARPQYGQVEANLNSINPENDFMEHWPTEFSDDLEKVISEMTDQNVYFSEHQDYPTNSLMLLS